MDTRPLAVYVGIDNVDAAPGIQLLREAGFEVIVAPGTDGETIATVAADAVALLVGAVPVDAALLRRLPALRVVSVAAQGHDNVDVAACARAGVAVGYVPAVAAEEVATHAWALTLALVRRLHWYRDAGENMWDNTHGLVSPRLSDLSIGILGTGASAERYAALASGHVAKTRAWSRSGRTLPGVTMVKHLGTLLGTSDVVSLHLPLAADTRGIVDESFLATMRAGSYLVNVARGALVDSWALARALDAGHLAAAALDVLEDEPPPPDHPLVGRRDVVITPHVAWESGDSLRRYIEAQVANVVAWHTEGQLLHPVKVPPEEPCTHRSGDAQ